MSELRDWYDRAAVSNRIIQPPVAELAVRGRRRAQRNRAVRLAGTTMAAALIAVPLLLMQGEGRSGMPAATSPPEPEPEREWGYGMELTFLDTDVGIAVYDVHAPDGTGCVKWLSVTQDGGSTWSELRGLPTYPQEEQFEDERNCVVPTVVPVSADVMVIPFGIEIQRAYQSADIFPPPITSPYISYDAGQTWRVSRVEGAFADVVPDGVVPSRLCMGLVGYSDGRFECEQPRVGWFDPQTGAETLLNHRPPAEWNGVTTAADGSIWLTGFDDSGGFYVSVSHDRGRTWLDESPAPFEGIEQPAEKTLAAADGDTAYLLWTAESAVYRTTDGGATWQPLPAELPLADVFDMWVARDGALVVSGDGEQYVSGDGGETFHPAEQPVWGVRAIAGGFVADGLDDPPAEDPYDGAISEDGLTWHGFHVPVPER